MLLRSKSIYTDLFDELNGRIRQQRRTSITELLERDEPRVGVAQHAVAVSANVQKSGT